MVKNWYFRLRLVMVFSLVSIVVLIVLIVLLFSD